MHKLSFKTKSITCITPCPFNVKKENKVLMVGSGGCDACKYRDNGAVGHKDLVHCKYKVKKQ